MIRILCNCKNQRNVLGEIMWVLFASLLWLHSFTGPHVKVYYWIVSDFYNTFLRVQEEDCFDNYWCQSIFVITFFVEFSFIECIKPIKQTKQKPTGCLPTQAQQWSPVAKPTSGNELWACGPHVKKYLGNGMPQIDHATEAGIWLSLCLKARTTRNCCVPRICSKKQQGQLGYEIFWTPQLSLN